MHASVARSLCPHNPSRLEASTPHFHYIPIYLMAIGLMYIIKHAKCNIHIYEPYLQPIARPPSLRAIPYLSFFFPLLILNA